MYNFSFHTSLLKWKYKAYLPFILLGIFFFLLPNNNPTGDAYAYAYSAISGEDVFYPHHLFHSALGFVVLRFFSFLPLEPLYILQGLNIFIGLLSLYFLKKILRLNDVNEKNSCYLLLFCGSCFSFIRFTIDYEAYILPTCLSLIVIYYMHKIFSEKNLHYVIYVALLCALACLFHQLSAILWFCCLLGIFFSVNKKHTMLFLILSFIIPFIYCIVFYRMSSSLNFKELMSFVLHDYLNGTAQAPNLKTMLVLTPISFVRTFIQVHGYMFNIIKSELFISIPLIVVCIALFIKGILQIKKAKQISKPMPMRKPFSIFLVSLVIAYILFAFISNGNAEFMLIVPFLLTILLANYFTHLRFVFYFAFSLLLWNTYFCLLPWNEKNFSTDRQLVSFIHNNKDKTYILTDKPKIENMYHYYYGEETLKLYYSLNLNTIKIKQLLSQDTIIYTDIFSSATISRANLSKSPFINKDISLFTIDSSSAVSFSSLYGNTILYRIRK